MSFPASWARIPVTATYLLRDDSGTPATGRVEFRSAQIVVADGSIIVPVRVTATLDSAGQISLSLPATDDPDIQPNSWTWTVTEIIDRQPRRSYSLSVPHTASSIDLSSISPIPPGSPVYDYLLTSAIGVTVAGQGDLDALDGRVTALEVAGGGVQLSDDTPESLGTASAGVGTEASRADHVHPMPSLTVADVTGAVGTTDPRLSDARTPTAHTHPSTDISDSTATGRAVLTAADAATARTAIDAPSSAQLAGVQATAEAALPKAGGTMTGAIVHSAHSKTARFGVADSPLGFGSIWYNGVQVAYFDNYSFSYLVTSYAARLGISVLGSGYRIAMSWTADGPQNGVLYVGLQGINPVDFSGANTVCMTFGGVGTPSQFRIRGGSGDVLTATEDGAVVVSGPIAPQNAFVAALPLVAQEGSIAYAINGRKLGEGPGEGTGVLVYYSAGKWRVFRDDSEVQA